MNRILLGDCRETLRSLPDQSVHCVVTSPPYFGLRDYGHGDQIGLEPTPDEFVAAMVEVFREVHRVLRDDGTFWLNLGDSYAANRTYQVPSTKGGKKHGPAQAAGGTGSTVPEGLKPKDLIGIPWRVAFALQADGWYLRQDIIWHKPNPMPESVRDRCTKGHEYIFMFSKRPKYFFDSEAMKEPAVKGASGSTFHKGKTAAHQLDRASEAPRTEDGMRNRRSVWTVASKPFKEAHFATYPPDLIEPCILAGTSEHGVCVSCGSPWDRIVERKGMVIDRSSRTHELGRSRSSGTMVEPASSRTVGWKPTCTCDAPTTPAVVLDPFFGAGTTGLVAQKHGRSWVGCELNPEYAAMASRRLGYDGGLPLDDDSFDCLLDADDFEALLA